MDAQDRAIQKLAKELAGIKREVVSWRGPQADYTSLENSGNITFKDSDGNVTAVVGGQDDGSNTIRHVDGPTPPIPSGLSAHVDGPIVQVSWGGSFESDVTHDWHYLEVLAVGPSNEQLTGTIDNADGGSTSLAATSQGDWFITARSVSRAGKRSLDGDAGTVAVELVGLTGAIDAIQESANGKNTIYYSPTEPDAPEGGFNNGDLWFDTSEEGNNTASVWDGNGWVSMEDARLATIIAAQEALESDLQDVQTSVDGKNTITYDPALPPSSYVGAVGDTWYRTSGNSMIGFWKWDGAAWVQQALSTTVIPQIDIGAGTFGSLKGTRLEAGSITADKLLVGYAAECVPNGTFAMGGSGWIIKSPGVVTPGAGDNGSTGVVFVNNNTSAKGVNSSEWPVASRPTYSVRVRYKVAQATTATGQLLIILRCTDKNGAFSYKGFNLPPVAANTWTTVTVALETTDVAVTASVQFSIRSGFAVGNTLTVDSVSAREAVGATLIENGAITTGKLAVGSITAESGIIESLDLGTATVGELDGIRIAAQTIRGQQLSGDAIDGKVITGGTYRTTGGTGSWSDDGLFIAQPDGTSMVRFPTDGSPLSLTASDVQIDRASITDLDLSYGAVRSGGQVTLASGVTAPASPPKLTTGWQKVASLDEPDVAHSYDWLGLDYWAEGAGWWVRAVNVLGVAGDTLDVFEVYDNDGIFSKSIQLDINPRAGVAVIGDVAYTIGPDKNPANKGKQWVHGFDLNTGERVTRWEFTRFDAPSQAKIAIGNDGTSLVVAGAHMDVSRRLYVMRYNPATGAQVGADIMSDEWVAHTKNVEAVHISGNSMWVSHVEAVREFTLSGSTPTYTDSGWENPNKNGAGMVWRDGLPYVADGVGDVYKGSPLASDVALEVCFVWTNGTYFTTPSPIATIDKPARQETTISLPVRAGLSKRVYTRTATAAYWAKHEIAENVTSARVPGGYQGETLPTTNTFPNADPATLKSTNNKFEVKGDGSGHWGNFNVDANGAMSGLIVTGQVVITPDAANVSKLATVTLPPGRFSRPPVVWVSIGTSVPHRAFVGCYQPTDTNTFDVYLNRDATTTTGIQWYAMDGE